MNPRERGGVLTRSEPGARQHAGGAAVTPENPDLQTLAARLERLADRPDALELLVRGLVTSQTVEAREFVVRDERGAIRARLEMEAHAPSLTFYDSLGTARLKIGLRTDSSPMRRVGQREIPQG
jgi:hypothetical protein